MLKALLLSFTLALAAMAMAQINLVPNGSFEDTVNCQIQTQCTLLKAEHWRNPNTATPDVWDEDINRLCGNPMPPSLGALYMPAYDGIRCAGAYQWNGPGNGPTREYLMVKLTSPLDAGMAYEVSLWYARRNGHGSGIDHISVWFGQDSIYENHYGWLAPTPQVRLRDPQNTYLTQADEWTQLTDTLIAAGGEQWMVIGNFDPEGEVNGSLVEGVWNPTCYYFIDEVWVHEISSLGLHDTPIEAWWSGDALILAGFSSEHQIQMKVWDITGRQIRSSAISQLGSHVAIVLAGLPVGVYIVDLASLDRRWTSKVLVK